MRMSSNTVVCVALALLLNLTGSVAQQDVCGQASLNTRIMGGGDATEGFWPWHVGIKRISTNYIFCGGSLINKDWVLTSAICSYSINVAGSSDIIIYLGRLKRSDSNTHEVNRTLSRVITHPNYTRSTYDNDIGLLQLSSSVDFTAHIKPVCLAAAGSEFDEGILSWVTGWGVNGSYGFPDTLQEAEIPIVSNYNCSVAYNNRISITDNMMCAGLTDGGKSTCFFDFGGPLVTKQNSRWIQAGIVPRIVSENCERSLPSVFIRVSKYQDWINTQIVNNQPGFITFPYYNNNTPYPTSSIPHITDVTDVSDVTDVPDVPDVIDVPDVTDVPDVPDVIDVPDVTDVTDVPDVTDVTDVPDVLDVPDVPDVTDVTDVPDVTDVTDVPDVLDVPDVPDVPDVTDVPDMFCGSSPALHLFPFYLTFTIISLIFCP